MIRDTLKKIEQTVRGAPIASSEKKHELLDLLDKLDTELETLEQTHEKDARTIAGLAEKATREATQPSDRPPAGDARAGLANSVRDFETTHPRLVSLVRAICDSLASVGI